ncbi:COG1470 family protein [Jidongwangia harbinensis]|uniref:COG1470 family protein n=1 Tax=Jidongwangia harbinensis TaxID=2878561 RepID=UPI001CD92E15|nr:hypothetical protein [Jidongwangia harbinensis]MCA2218199.1 hypothetical protein [Jidongwangia harbinensis]
MTVELTLPAEPVTLAPGVVTRVPVELRNLAAAPAALRLAVARGRAAGWAVDPPAVTVDPYATTGVDLVLQTPPDQPPSPSLVPFTVHALDAATGEPAGFATGLLTVALPVPVSGALTARTGEPHAFDLRLVNDSDRPAPVRITAELDPPAGSIAAEPAAVRLEPGESRTALVRAKPARPFMGTPKPYFVVVAVTDAHDPDRPPLFTATGNGSRKPRVRSWMAGTAAVVLALAATAAVALSDVRLPLPGTKRAAKPAATPTTPAVSRPYALVDVFPHRGPDGGKAEAESQRARLDTAGMPVKLVDSLASDVLEDKGTGFWVLLQDGFANPEAAQAFCTQWRVVAPKCAVTP